MTNSSRWNPDLRTLERFRVLCGVGFLMAGVLIARALGAAPAMRLVGGGLAIIGLVLLLTGIRAATKW